MLNDISAFSDKHAITFFQLEGTIIRMPDLFPFCDVRDIIILAPVVAKFIPRPTGECGNEGSADGKLSRSVCLA